MLNNHFQFEPRQTCICGSPLTSYKNVIERRFIGGTVRFLKCTTCQSWCQSPQLSNQSLKTWFESDYYCKSQNSQQGPYISYLEDEPHRLKESRSRVRRDFINKLSRGSKIYEVGCGTGSLLKSLNEAGFIVEGIDLSRPFVEFGLLNYKLSVQCGEFLSDGPSKKNQWDAVIFVGTMPTLQNFERHLQKCFQILKPGGKVFFNFPATKSMAHYIYRSKFWMFSPSVSTFMSRKGCLDILRKSGFSKINIKMDRQTPSVAKIWGHSRLNTLIPYEKLPRFFKKTATRLMSPNGILIPGVYGVWAEKSLLP